MSVLKENFSKKDTKKLLRNSAVTIIIVIVAVVIINIWPGQKKEEPHKAEFSDVNTICELATLRCYYHDVAEYEKQSDGLFKYGYKKSWIEYDGIVEIGIDVGKVQVDEPDENGVVKIYIPDAEILNINADADSMNESVSDTGIFTKITTTEKAEAFSEAQATMKNNAEADSSILLQAHDNAKKLLKQYVINIGEQIGQHYTVEWSDKPADKDIQKGE